MRNHVNKPTDGIEALLRRHPEQSKTESLRHDAGAEPKNLLRAAMDLFGQNLSEDFLPAPLRDGRAVVTEEFAEDRIVVGAEPVR